MPNHAVEHPTIPAALKLALSSLNDTNARTVWEWLDSHPYTVFEMISALASTHPAVAKALCDEERTL